jgi:hypothetical protein
MDQLSRNKEVVRQYVEAFNRGNLDDLRKLFAPDAVIQGVLKKGQMDEILPIWQALHDGLAINLTVDEIIADLGGHPKAAINRHRKTGN